MKVGRIVLDEQPIEAFGSAVRDDFRPQSDVDLLITFAVDVRYGLLDLARMEEEFEEVIGRNVDLVEKRLLKWVIRDRVLEEAQLVYAA